MKFPNSSFEHVDNIKLRLYQAGLIIACAVLSMLYWQMRRLGPLSGEERFVLPTALVFCIVSMIVLKIYKQRYLVFFDFITCSLLWTYDLAHYVMGLDEARRLNVPIDFDRFFLWLPIIYAVFFLCFPIKQATIVSGIFLLSLGIPAAHHLWQIQNQKAFAEDFAILVSTFASGIVFTLIFFTLATLKERYVEALSTAKILKIRAEVDYLTQVYSRAKIFELLNWYVANAPTSEYPFSIMVIDMDNLKSINDKYGHDVGDQALKQSTVAIRNTVRRSDLIGRIGGDEFLIICPETGTEEIGKLEVRLQKAIGELRIIPEVITISCGSATWQPGDTVESLFRRADQTMYQHKNQKKTLI